MLQHAKPDPSRIREILARSLELEILSLSDVSGLLTLQDPDLWQEVFDTARRVKEKVYGRRIVLFAPLYLSNTCVNDCLYCGFRAGNRKAKRRNLDASEAVQEASMLESKGYRRLLLVSSEHPKISGADYLGHVIESIYSQTDIRILHLNSAPLNTVEFRELKSFGVGVYQCFQETYHLSTYMRMHPSGPKADYERRIGVMDRAIEAGFEDVGMGVLLGLYDWRWDVWALLAHCHRLLRKYGFGPHTLSVPRIQPAEGTQLRKLRFGVSDADVKKIVAIYRLALPYVGIVVSTRESPVLRDELLLIGASQVSAGSSTSPGGYIKESDTAQFQIGDTRNLEQVMATISGLGLIPSLCTACYREKRSGEHFRQLAEGKAMRSLCQENALLTLKEYIEDYASEDLRRQFLDVVKEIGAKQDNGLSRKFRLIEEGKRDLHV